MQGSVWSWSTKASSRAQRRPISEATAEGLVDRLGHPTRQVVSTGDDDASILFDDVGSVEHITSAPLRRRGELLGILQLVDHQLDAFDDGALRLLALLAAQLGQCIEVQRARTAERRHERLMAVGKAVSAVLHDLRTPLSAVDGYVALLDETGDAAERQEIAERIRRALHHTEAMTREVLEFARGHHEVRIEPLQLDTFVEQARELLAPEIERAGATLRIDERWSGTVHFDRSKIMRIVTNLVRNACQAMPSCGQITWTLDRVDEGLCMRFHDNGPGIPPAVRSHLFEFFTTHGKHGGTGLGLAMARQIAEAHGGTVTLQASSPAGTLFEVCLPVI